MPIIKNGVVIDDPWIVIADDAPIPVSRPVIVSLARWLAEREALQGRNGLLGVRLRSDELAEDIAADLERQHHIGELKLKISGCINACGHHHVGHIGILGVDKRGEEFYQITLGGSADEAPSIGKIIGPAFPYDKVVDAIETLTDTYLAIRAGDERFVDTVRRTGMDPFKEALYADH